MAPTLDQDKPPPPKKRTAKTRSRKRRPLESVSRPKQARSERTLERILDAAETLILERGLKQVSIGDIVREAGSSVGGFYARFKDKGELLVALSEQTQRRLAERVAALMDPGSWGDATLREIVHVCAQEIVGHVLSRRRLQSAILQSVAADSSRWKHGIEFRTRLVEGVTALMLTRREEIRHPMPERAARFAIEAALALMDQRALFGDLQEQWRLEEDTLIEEMERMVLAYLDVAP